MASNNVGHAVVGDEVNVIELQHIFELALPSVQLMTTGTTVIIISELCAAAFLIASVATTIFLIGSSGSKDADRIHHAP